MFGVSAASTDEQWSQGRRFCGLRPAYWHFSKLEIGNPAHHLTRMSADCCSRDSRHVMGFAQFEMEIVDQFWTGFGLGRAKLCNS